MFNDSTTQGLTGTVCMTQDGWLADFCTEFESGTMQNKVTRTEIEMVSAI